MPLVDAANRALRRVPTWTIYIGGALLPVWLLWQGTTGGLGVEPVKAIEKQLGLWGLQLIVAGLCVTPLRRFTGLNLIRFRRAIGLVAFFMIVLHFLSWLVLDMGLLWAQALGDIVKRPYVTVGMIGLVALIPLALTSNDKAVRRLGPARWQRLHRLTYLVAVAGAVHFLWLVKAWPLEPFLYLGAVGGLLTLRLKTLTGQRAGKQKGAATPPPVTSG